MLRKSSFLADKLALLVVVAGLVVLSPPVMAKEAAGVVLMVAGQLHAEKGEEARQLKRKSSFFEGETLVTAAGSKAQVRFRDGSLISMRAETAIRIDTFRLNQPDEGEDAGFFTLINGGFRTITGSIGKKKPENYQMKSSVASIGIRGTTYEAVLNNELVVAAWQGTILVDNEGGSLVLGEGGAYDFAVVRDVYSSPDGLLLPPPVLEGPGEPVAATPEQRQEPRRSQVRHEDKTPGENRISRLRQGILGVPLVRRAMDESRRLPKDVDEQLREDEKQQDAQGVTSEFSLQSNDFLTASATRPRVGLGIVSGLKHYGGIGKLDGDSFSLTDNGLDPSQDGFYTTEPTYWLSQGSAPLRAGSLQRLSLAGGYDLAWGVWDASTLNPARLLVKENDVLRKVDITNTVYWMTGPMTPKAEVNALTGKGRYQIARGYIGDTNFGAITDLQINLGIDFAQDGFTGTLKISHNSTHNSQLWNLDLSGRVDGSMLAFSAPGGTVYVNDIPYTDITGEILGGLSGKLGGTAFVAFDLSLAGRPEVSAEGMFAVSRDLRLDDVAAQLSHAALGVVGGKPTSDTFYAVATNGSDSKPVMAVSDVASLSSTNQLSNVKEVLRLGSGAIAQVATADTSFMLTSDSAYTVRWGKWDNSSGPISSQTDNDDPSVKTAAGERLYWMTLKPSPASAITTRVASGVSVGYANTVMFEGGAYDGVISGPISSFSANFQVDFVNSSVPSGQISFLDSGANNWLAQFSGTLSGPAMKLTVNDVSFNSAGGGSGQVNGMLTGPQAEGLAGSFDLQNAAKTNHAEGIFLVNCIGDTNC